MLQKVKILVEYTQSKMSGSIPHAHIEVETDDSNYVGITTGYAKATGNGYDKTSSAIADALNQIPAVRTFLEREATVRFLYGADDLTFKIGGVGVSSILDVFQKNGFEVDHITFANAESKAFVVTKKR